MKTSCDPGVRESPRLQRATVGLGVPWGTSSCNTGWGRRGGLVAHSPRRRAMSPPLNAVGTAHWEGTRGQAEGPPQSSFNIPQADQRPCLTSRTQFQAFSYIPVMVPLWFLCASHTCTYTHTHTHTCTYTHTVSRPYTPIPISTSIHTHTHTRSHTLTHPYTLSHTYPCTHFHTVTYTILSHPYTLPHTHTHIQPLTHSNVQMFVHTLASPLHQPGRRFALQHACQMFLPEEDCKR